VYRYHRALTADVLRQIHASVAPLHPALYPPTLSPGLLAAGQKVMLGALYEQCCFNGLAGTIEGWDDASGRYQVKLGSRQPVHVLVGPENALPLSRDLEGAASY